MDKKTLSLKKDKGKLCDDWLKTFPVFQSHLLLDIGIHIQLKGIYDQIENPGFGFKWVRIQLRRRTKKKWYLELLSQDMPRYGLDTKKPCGQ